MAIRYSGEVMGVMTIEQDSRRFKIEIRQGNCLAVFIHIAKAEDEKGYIHTLYNFFSNEQHIKNIIKNKDRLFWDKVVSCKLNLKYKECSTLAKYFAMEGIKTNVYYK